MKVNFFLSFHKLEAEETTQEIQRLSLFYNHGGEHCSVDFTYIHSFIHSTLIPSFGANIYFHFYATNEERKGQRG